MDWNEAAEAFLLDARLRECSPATIENYRTYLLGPRACEFLADYRIESIADVTPRALSGFQRDLLEAGLAAGTAATFHRIVRNFLGFCQRQGWGVGSEALTVAPPGDPSLQPETFSVAEERRILDAARTERDRFLIEFMLRTGLTLSETAEVRIDDIFTGAEGPHVRVPSRRRRTERIVPLDTSRSNFSKRLTPYLRTVRPRDAADRHLFLQLRRDPATGQYGALDARGIKMVLRRIGMDTGIHVHAQKFRDTFAVRALAAGVDSLALQKALGHKKLAMVSRYVRLQERDVMEAWRARRD